MYLFTTPKSHVVKKTTLKKNQIKVGGFPHFLFFFFNHFCTCSMMPLEKNYSVFKKEKIIQEQIFLYRAYMLEQSSLEEMKDI